MEKIKIEELIILCVSYSDYKVVYGTTTVWDPPWAIQVHSKYMEKIKLEELIIYYVYHIVNWSGILVPLQYEIFLERSKFI